MIYSDLQIMASIANALIFLVLSLLPILYLKKVFQLPWINPLSVTFAVIFPIEICKAILGPIFSSDDFFYDLYYQYSLMIENFRLFLVLLVTIIFLNSLRYLIGNGVPVFIRGLGRMPESGLKKLQIFFLVCSFLVFYYMSSNTFGFLNWLYDPRTGYQYYRVGYGLHYALSLTFLSLSFSFGLLRIKSEFKALILSIVYVLFVYFWGSKGFIISFFIFLLIYLWFLGGRLLVPISITGGLSVFILVLVNLSSSYGGLDIDRFFSYFDHYVNSSLYYREYFTGNIRLFYGELMLTDAWSLVPRGVYPEKPFVYGLLHINEIFFPGAAKLGHTPAFGGPVMAFADFGLLGVFLSVILDVGNYLYLFSIYILFKCYKLELLRTNIGPLFVFIVVYSPSYLHYIPSIYGIVISLFVLFLIATLGRLRFIKVKNDSY